MRGRLTGVTKPGTGVSKSTGSSRVERSVGGPWDRQLPGIGCRVPAAARECGDPSNTFVAICTEAVNSLLKTWVSTHTVKDVSVSRECRFVWQ